MEILEVTYARAFVLFLLGQKLQFYWSVLSIKEVQHVHLFLIVLPLNRVNRSSFEVFVAMGAAQGATGREVAG